MRTAIIGLLLILSASGIAQDSLYKHELKVKSGITDFKIIQADQDNYFLVEKRLNPSNVNSDDGKRYFINISKLDKDFKQLWWKEYFVALAEFDVIDLKIVKGQLIIFLSKYKEKSKEYIIDIAKVDLDGKIPKTKLFTRVATYPRGERRENYFQVRVEDVQNGYLLLSNISGKKSSAYGITKLSDELITVSNTVIHHETAPKLYSIADVKIHKDRFVVLGKQFSETITVDGKTTISFKNHILSIYNLAGMPEGEAALSSGIISAGKLTEIKDNLLFTGLYNKYTLRDIPDGVLTATIDPVLRQLKIITDSIISPDIFASIYDGEKDTSELYKKLPLLSLKNRRRFADTHSWIEHRNVDINPTNGTLMISAEIVQLDEYDEYVYGNSHFGLAGIAMPTAEIIKVYEYKLKDILLVQADPLGKINRINVVRKNQQETSMYVKPTSSTYSSFKTYFTDGSSQIIYNDYDQNTAPVDDKKPVNVIWNFKKEAALFKIKVEPTGEITKSVLARNNLENPVPLPGKAIHKENILVIPGFVSKPLAKDLILVGEIND